MLAAGANPNIKSKEGKSPFILCFKKGMTDLISLFGQNIDINSDPSLFFVFSGVQVASNKSQALLLDCFHEKRLEDEVINYVNDEGFTPFLYYILEFCKAQKKILNSIQHILTALGNGVKIDNQMIIDELTNE